MSRSGGAPPRPESDHRNPSITTEMPGDSNLRRDAVKPTGGRQWPPDQVALRLNQRPRKTLGFQTPASKLQASVASTIWAGPVYQELDSEAAKSRFVVTHDLIGFAEYGRFHLARRVRGATCLRDAFGRLLTVAN
jgi:hypothetical protein